MRDELPCTLPWRAFNVDNHDGIACACCMDRTRVAYGSIMTDSIESLWNGERAQYVRQMIAGGNIGAVCRPDCPTLLYGWERESLLVGTARPPSDASMLNSVWRSAWRIAAWLLARAVWPLTISAATAKSR